MTAVSEGSAAPGPAGGGATAATARLLSPREARWLLRRCGRKGHVIAFLDDPLAGRFAVTDADDHDNGSLLRCLRCGLFVSPEDPGVSAAHRYGTADRPVPLSALPLVVRGAHGRKLALLRLLAVERAGRGLVLAGLALGLARLASSHVAVAEWLGQLVMSSQPLAKQLGWDITDSHVVEQAQSLLGSSSSTFTLAAWGLGGYGLLQVVEAVGLWGGWLWAEYLAAVATSLFVPLEVYELTAHPTPLKAGALVLNIAVVGYLVLKGRLFGVRGGHAAYLAEVRDATLLADALAQDGRPTAELTGHRLV